MTEHYELKRISKDGVPAALQKAERYRVINDPSSAESICLDVLAVDPSNQSALVTLLLAITDQFAERPAEGARRAQELLPRLDDEYKRMYYAGIVAERGAKAHLRRATVASGELAYHLFREAMSWYEQAEAPAAAGERRGDPAVEHLRAHPGAGRAHPAAAGGGGEPGIGVTSSHVRVSRAATIRFFGSHSINAPGCTSKKLHSRSSVSACSRPNRPPGRESRYALG